MAVSTIFGSFFWVSLKYEPYYLGSIVFRPLILEISICVEHASPMQSNPGMPGSRARACAATLAADDEYRRAPVVPSAIDYHNETLYK